MLKDIISKIYDYLDQATLIAAGKVCKIWYGVFYAIRADYLEKVDYFIATMPRAVVAPWCSRIITFGSTIKYILSGQSWGDEEFGTVLRQRVANEYRSVLTARFNKYILYPDIYIGVSSSYMQNSIIREYESIASYHYRIAINHIDATITRHRISFSCSMCNNTHILLYNDDKDQQFYNEFTSNILKYIYSRDITTPKHILNTIIQMYLDDHPKIHCIGPARIPIM